MQYAAKAGHLAELTPGEAARHRSSGGFQEIGGGTELAAVSYAASVRPVDTIDRRFSRRARLELHPDLRHRGKRHKPPGGGVGLRATNEPMVC